MRTQTSFWRLQPAVRALIVVTAFFSGIYMAACDDSSGAHSSTDVFETVDVVTPPDGHPSPDSGPEPDIVVPPDTHPFDDVDPGPPDAEPLEDTPNLPDDTSTPVEDVPAPDDTVAPPDATDPADTNGPGDTTDPCDPCDDNILCTNSDCIDGVCTHEPFGPDSEEILYRFAPHFALVDANTHSATAGRTISLADDLDGYVVLLMFHSSTCESCLEMGQGARALFEDYADDDGVFFATINADDSADSVDDYIDFFAALDSEGRPLPDIQGPTGWAVLQDTEAARVWRSYCATNNRVLILDGWGRVQYTRVANLKDQPFRNEVSHWIELSKESLPPEE